MRPVDPVLDAAAAAQPAAGAFARIVCGVDGSAQADEAVRQAAALGGPGAELVLVSVACETGMAGGAWRPPLDPLRAREATARGARVAAQLAVRASTRVVSRPAVDAVLLREAATAGLLVVAARAEPGSADVGLGRLPILLLHRARVPTLFARRPPAGATFPEPVLVGRGGTGAAGRVAAAIARRSGSGTAVIADGGPADELVERACRDRAALIVVGARKRDDVAGRVAQRASCSVLVVPDGSV